MFLHNDLWDDPDQPAYEERIVLLKATSFEHASLLAEEEARTYAFDNSECVYTGFLNIYHLFDADVGHGTEVWSLMRTSGLDTKSYLDTFYDTGAERAGKLQG